MADGKMIGAAGAAAVAAALGGKALVGSVHVAEMASTAGRDLSEVTDIASTSGRRFESFTENNIGRNFDSFRADDTQLNRGRDFYHSDNSLNGSNVPPLPTLPRSVIAFPPDYYNFHLSVKVHTLYDRAEPQIITDINHAHGSLTQSQVDSIINRELVKTITIDSSKPNSNISFEVATGKLKVQRSATMLGVDFTVGEVNVYKISAIVAGSVYGCQKLTGSQFHNCVNRAFDGVGRAMRKAILEDSADNSK
jgi:hypothetical protein